MGIVPFHVHEVAHDCVANKTSAERYGHVCIVEIPDEHLAEMKRVNMERAKSSPLMPKFNPEKFKYVAASKTHFVHAQKLLKDGGRSLYDRGGVPIRFHANDSEGPLIAAHGPLCAIFRSTLMSDKPAMKALAGEDNLNALVTMGEDEMVAFGRVHEEVEKKAREGVKKVERRALIQEVLELVRTSGLGPFTEEEWKCLITLRVDLPSKVAKVLQTCQFSTCQSRVRVRCGDFGTVAKMDPRYPWAKACVLLHQYISSLPPPDAALTQSTFAGRKERTAKRLPSDAMKEVSGEGQFLRDMQDFVLEVLKRYILPTSLGQGRSKEAMELDLVDARAHFMSHAGELVVKVGAELDKAVKKAEGLRLVLAPADRQKIVDDQKADKKLGLAATEEEFRKGLQGRKLYDAESLPDALHPVKEVAKASSQEGGDTQLVDLEAMRVGDGSADALTEAHVFERLGITRLGDTVLAQVGPERVSSEAHEEQEEEGAHEDVKEELDVEQEEEDLEWKSVRLLRLMLPDAAEVETLPGDTNGGQGEGEPEVVVVQALRRVKVRVDQLRPQKSEGQKKREKREKASEKKSGNVHPSIRDDGEALGAYCFLPLEGPCLQALTEHLLMQAHLTTEQTIPQVSVSNVSVKDDKQKMKLPITLQVRAKDYFRKGHLILVPFGGQLIEADKESELRVSKTSGTVHEAMAAAVEIIATMAPLRKRKRSDEAASQETRKESIRKYHMLSPLLAGKAASSRDKCLDNVAPFWGLLRTASPLAKPNMELQHFTLKDPGFDGSLCPRPFKANKCWQATVTIPFAVNTVPVAKEDVLILPWKIEDVVYFKGDHELES